MPQLDKASGLDIHKDKIIGFVSDREGNVQEWKEFGTFTSELEQLRDWLVSHQIKHCLMESTGVYWMALYAILINSNIDVVVANAQHIKQIPKRKTDRKDAKWLCTLLLYGLVRKSFIPDTVQRMLRTYCRQRLSYEQSRSRVFNRIIKILESQNIKLRSVVSNIHTQTAMGIIKLLCHGETDMEKLLSCVKGAAKRNLHKFPHALKGTLDMCSMQQLRMLIEDIAYFDKQIAVINQQINLIVLEHYTEVIQIIDSVSGVGKKSAEIIISEIGDNMEKFNSSDHLTAWCGLAPGNNESAGKRKNTSIKKGNKYLRVAMIAVAWAAARKKNSYWKGLFTHLNKRMKSQKAIVAVARRILKVIYNCIQNRTMYEEKGIDYFLELQLRNRARSLMK